MSSKCQRLDMNIQCKIRFSYISYIGKCIQSWKVFEFLQNHRAYGKYVRHWTRLSLPRLKFKRANAEHIFYTLCGFARTQKLSNFGYGVVANAQQVSSQFAAFVLFFGSVQSVPRFLIEIDHTQNQYHMPIDAISELGGWHL